MDYSSGGNDLCSWKTGVVSIISGMDAAAGVDVALLQPLLLVGRCFMAGVATSDATILVFGIRYDIDTISILSK